MVSEIDSRQKPRRSVSIQILFFSLVLAVLLGSSGCNSLEDGVGNAKSIIPKGYSVVQIEQVNENSGIVFYTFEEELSVGIFVKNTLGWDWIGSGVGKLVTYPEGLQWRYAELSDKNRNQYFLYYGKVDNPEIARITVATMDGVTVEAKIVDTSELRLWYAFVSKPQVPSANADITGYSADGKVKYLFSQPKE